MVLFPACVGSMFGPEGGGVGAAAAFRALAARAGLGMVEVGGANGLCCGTPWKSKGLRDGYAEATAATVRALLVATQGGELPVVCDASSCTEGLRHAIEAQEGTNPQARRIRVVDAVQIVADEVLDRLVVRERLGSLALHPTCSSVRLGAAGALVRVAQACADVVDVPDDVGCCAFAGDRGMLHPELTASATAAEAAHVRAGEYDGYASCNRTCEIGMARATGRPYRHVLEILDDLTR